MGSADDAIATYMASSKNNPKEPTFYILLGELYESKHDVDRATQMYRKALEVNPGNPLASNNLAYLMTQTGGNLDVALDLAQTARLGMPDSANAADTLGWVYFRKNEFKPAIDQLQEALRLVDKARAPQNAAIHYHLGLAYQKNDQPALAREQFRRVLEIDPGYSAATIVKQELARLGSGSGTN